MFTGIITALGHIEAVRPFNKGTGLYDNGVNLTISAPEFDFDGMALGDSIAIQGACMTVVAKRPSQKQFDVDVSAESLSKTVGLNKPGAVNLEKSLALGDKLGGHLVSGHVDGLGRVVVFEPVGESWRLDIEAAPSLGKFFATKGSATVNGVSLTTNTVTDTAAGTLFSINIIPHTLAVTTLQHLTVGDSVNLEIDLFARYCERMMSYRG